MEFAYDGGGLAKGGTSRSSSTANKVGAGSRRGHGADALLRRRDDRRRLATPATPVSDDYARRDSAFNGRVEWVQIDIDEAAEDVDHLISPEERLRIAMARQ